MERRRWRQRARRTETARPPRPATRPRVAEATLTVPLLLAVRARRAAGNPGAPSSAQQVCRAVRSGVGGTGIESARPSPSNPRCGADLPSFSRVRDVARRSIRGSSQANSSFPSLRAYLATRLYAPLSCPSDSAFSVFDLLLRNCVGLAPRNTQPRLPFLWLLGRTRGFAQLCLYVSSSCNSTGASRQPRRIQSRIWTSCDRLPRTPPADPTTVLSDVRRECIFRQTRLLAPVGAQRI
jgi:hypothetical protein